MTIFNEDKSLTAKSRAISIQTCFDYTIPLAEQMPMIAGAGFSHVSLGAKETHSRFLSSEGRKEMKDLLEKHKLSLDTIHAPSRRYSDLSSTDQDIATYAINLLKATAIVAADLTVPVVVVHASPFQFKGEELDGRLETLKTSVESMLPIAEKFNVKFALENLSPGPATGLIQNFFESFDSEYIGFCYDSSHDQIDGPKPFELLDNLKDKLIAVHISDRIRPFVDHVIPGEGVIDWEQLCDVMKNCNIKIPLLLEIMIQNSNIKDPERFLETAYRRACCLYDAAI